jgi:beta-lactamase regulating signal transducer with metallopeptidase domain
MPDMMAVLVWNTMLATLMAGVLVVLARTRCLQVRPGLRHALWLLVFARLVAPPLVPIAILPARNANPVEPLLTERVQSVGFNWAQAISGSDPATAEPITTKPLPQIKRQNSLETSAVFALLDHARRPLSTVLLVLSATGSCVLLGLALHQSRQLNRLLVNAEWDGGFLRSEASRIARTMGLAHGPLVRVVEGNVMPMLWISRRGPMIVLPKELIGRLDREQVRCILAHEMAHYVRRDHWANAFALLVTGLFWWNPLVWLARRELRAAQEVCCDSLVLAQSGTSRRAYAEMLLLALEFTDAQRPALPEMANGIGKRSSLQRRFEMLAQLKTTPRLSWTTRIILVILVALLPCLPTQAEIEGNRPEEAASNATTTSEQPVLEIRIVGNRAITRDKVLANIGLRIDRPFDQLTFEKDVRKLATKGWFVDVRPRAEHVPGGVIVTFEVVERPSLDYVKYFGNKKMTSKTLAKETGLKKGDSLDSCAIEEGRRKIERLYQTKGHNETKVTVLEGTKPNDRGAVYLISEGIKQKIWRVKFEGNTVASDGRLKTQIQSKPPVVYFFKGIVDRKKIDEDVERLTVYYRSLGFFKAHVGSDYEFNEKDNSQTVTFVINEGPRYRIRKVRLIGNTLWPESALAKRLKLKAGDHFDQTKMNADVEYLRDLYQDNGFQFANVKADLRFYEQPGDLDLSYQITGVDPAEALRRSFGSPPAAERDEVEREHDQAPE